MASSKVTTDNITAGPVWEYAFDDTTPASSSPIDIRNYDGFSVHLVVDGTSPAGDWTIGGSNDFATQTSASPAQAGAYGQPGNTGHFPDITALFTQPAPVAPVTDASSQIVQPAGHCSVRHIQFTFTPSGGSGVARVYLYGKSWSA